MKKVTVDGLEPQEQRAVTAALETITRTEKGNARRALYMDADYTVRALGLHDAPSYSRLSVVLGWPAKAVRSLSTLCRNEGVIADDGRDYGIADWWDDNNLRVEASQALDLALIYGPAFLCTTLGDPAAGEPAVVTTVRPPTSGAGEWNPRTRRLDYFLSVTDVATGTDGEGSGRPTAMTLYLPGVNVSCRQDGRRWTVVRRKHVLPYVPVTPLVFQARHDRVFGTSRISRPVRDLTDRAVATIIRAEQGAEAYINPQRYMLGADMSQFADDNGVVRTDLIWRALAGRMVAIGANLETEDEKPIIPQVGQFQQLDMTPHLAQLESYAAFFASETDLPVSSLGITKSQNPASAEAILAAKDDLINLSDKTTLESSGAFETSAMTAFMLREGLSKRPSGVRFRSLWRDPRTLSLAASADAVVKLTAGDRPIIPPESDVALEQLGLSRSTIARVQAERRRVGVRSDMARLADQIASRPRAGAAAPVVSVPTDPQQMPDARTVTYPNATPSGT